MRPAYHIPLTRRQRGQIGTLVATQGQIDWTMQLAVMRLLKVEFETALRIMGSTSVANNADIWLRVVREKHPLDDAKAWAEYGFRQIADLAAGRNDFIHAIFGIDAPEMMARSGLPRALLMSRAPRDFRGFITDAGGQVAAARLRSRKMRPISDISEVCAQAAKLSVITSFVADACESEPALLATWRRRLGSRLPPQSRSEATPPAKAP